MKDNFIYLYSKYYKIALVHGAFTLNLPGGAVSSTIYWALKVLRWPTCIILTISSSKFIFLRFQACCSTLKISLRLLYMYVKWNIHPLLRHPGSKEQSGKMIWGAFWKLNVFIDHVITYPVIYFNWTSIWETRLSDWLITILIIWFALVFTSTNIQY